MIRAIKTAVESDPYSPDARLSLGRMLVRQGNAQDGIAQLREAVQLAPENEDARRALTVAQEGESRRPFP